MVIDGFSWAPAAIFYVIAMLLLSSHLSHGFSSLFQTLGLSTHRTEPLFKKLGHAFALLILVGNCSIPIAILVFGYGRLILPCPQPSRFPPYVTRLKNSFRPNGISDGPSTSRTPS
jgi:hypothetical protein